jgi:hypothetical protein
VSVGSVGLPIAFGVARPSCCGDDVDAEEIGEYSGGQLGREHDQGCVAACARADPTLFESPREDSRVDRSVGGAARVNYRQSLPASAMTFLSRGAGEASGSYPGLSSAQAIW